MFPQLPSGNNPYAASAEGYAASAHAVLNSLRAAHYQQQELAARQKNEEATRAQQTMEHRFENENKLREKGGVPYELYQGPDPTGPASNRASLLTPSVNPLAGQGEGQDVIEPMSGKKWWVPSERQAAENKLDDSNSFIPTGQLAKTLEQFGVKPGHRVSATAAHQIMQTINLAQAGQNEPVDIDTSGKFKDPQGNPIPVMIGKKTGTVTQLDMSHIAQQIAADNAPAQTPAAPAPGAGPGAPPPGGLPGGAFDASKVGAPGGAGLGGTAATPQSAFAGPQQPAPQMAPGGGAGLGGMPQGAFAAPAQIAQPPAAPAVTPTATAKKPGPSFSVDKPKPEKETPDDWIRIITDPKSKPDEKKRAQAALDLARAPGTESDKDRDLTRKALAADRAERRQERQETRTEAQKKVNRGIDSAKEAGIDKANKAYKAAAAIALTPEAKKAALTQLRSDLDEVQTHYETQVGIEQGTKPKHDTWAQTYDPEGGKGGKNDPLGIRGKGKPDPLGIR